MLQVPLTALPLQSHPRTRWKVDNVPRSSSITRGWREAKLTESFLRKALFQILSRCRLPLTLKQTSRRPSDRSRVSDSIFETEESFEFYEFLSLLFLPPSESQLKRYRRTSHTSSFSSQPPVGCSIALTQLRLPLFFSISHLPLKLFPTVEQVILQTTYRIDLDGSATRRRQ